MRLIADTERCVGAGQCVLTEPELFDQSDHDGTVILLHDTPEGPQLEKAREAVGICPAQALMLSEE
jgi:ferredoxin